MAAKRDIRQHSKEKDGTIMTIEHDTTRRIPRCFMTGRICIHESEIKKRLDEMKRGEGDKEAFVVMPFYS